jgi:hypothetical protein
LWEEKVGISEKALAKVNADLYVERAKAEATRKEYIEKMAAHTARAKHSLDLDKILEPPMLNTPSTSIRFWRRRRSNSMGESKT